MDKLLKNKTSIIAIVLLILAFFFYSVFFGSDAPSEPVVAATETEAPLLDLADKLSNITFEQGLFSMPGYKMLTDFSTPLVPQPVGRSNPFDSVGRD